MSTILVVDDEANLRRLLAAVLREDGHRVLEASSLGQARAKLGEGDVDLVITDQKLGDGDGLAVLAAAHELVAGAPVLLLTAYATVELAVSAMRAGAFDVIGKPFDPEGMRAAVRRAAHHAGLVRENQLLRERVGRMGGAGEFVGEALAMRRLKELVAKVAPTGATVLIHGETGTGKELVARAIHRQSARSAGPFIAVNCAALPEGLLESELFGHEKGAFTSADRARPGMFEAADGGTLFLDEAGEMAPALQAKLLRVLTDGIVTRVGARSARKVDVRLLVATHRDLAARVRAGEFREDLFFRLAVVPLEVPPLRERMDDLPALVDHLVGRACRELAIPRRAIADEALGQLRGYSFPGNVRELRNIIERACILASGPAIGVKDLLMPGTSTSDGVDPLRRWVHELPGRIPLAEVVARVEQLVIERAMEQASGVQAEAARRLGVSRSDLHYKLHRNGLAARR
jgi:two-component system response regulator PilR (NtrC family)